MRQNPKKETNSFLRYTHKKRDKLNKKMSQSLFFIAFR